MHPYLIPLIRAFTGSCDSANAAAMKKYMRGQFEYHGIKSPVRAELQREFLSNHGLPTIKELPAVINEAWELEQREYQYFSMELVLKMIKNTGPDFITVLENMIIKKSWWDTVDFIAAFLAGKWFEMYPGLKDKYIRKWMNSDHIWLQRTCLLFQLKYKKRTDPVLLSSLILRLNGSKEFFINKAIGWALREYSKTNPLWVVEFTTRNKLPNLSHREALKWLERKNKLIEYEK